MSRVTSRKRSSVSTPCTAPSPCTIIAACRLAFMPAMPMSPARVFPTIACSTGARAVSTASSKSVTGPCAPCPFVPVRITPCCVAMPRLPFPREPRDALDIPPTFLPVTLAQREHLRLLEGAKRRQRRVHPHQLPPPVRRRVRHRPAPHRVDLLHPLPRRECRPR